MKTVALLGPNGTFSHQAFVENFEMCKSFFLPTIRDVFEEVKNGKADFGLVPIENSIGGTVGETLDCLTDYNLFITQEILMPISHNLVGFLEDPKKIKKLYCHSQTYSQCEMFIRKNLKSAKVINTFSNSNSAELLSNDKEAAAIVPKISAIIYNLPIIKSNIQDNPNNTTKFIIISTKMAKSTGKDRTSISIYPEVDKPGLLHHILGHFAKYTLNLTKIESRPSKGKLGDYIFFIDFLGSVDDGNVKSAIEELRAYGKIKIYGSYVRVY
jgi:chorismate mutase / prephenate dehydratase